MDYAEYRARYVNMPRDERHYVLSGWKNRASYALQDLVVFWSVVLPQLNLAKRYDSVEIANEHPGSVLFANACMGCSGQDCYTDEFAQHAERFARELIEGKIP